MVLGWCVIVLAMRPSPTSAVGVDLAESKFKALEDWVHPKFQPDLTFLFDVSPEVAAERLAAGREHADRFEREQRDFFDRVRSAYLHRAEQSHGRIAVIDANRSPNDICADVLACLEQRFA